MRMFSPDIHREVTGYKVTVPYTTYQVTISIKTKKHYKPNCNALFMLVLYKFN